MTWKMRILLYYAMMNNWVVTVPRELQYIRVMFIIASLICLFVLSFQYQEQAVWFNRTPIPQHMPMGTCNGTWVIEDDEDHPVCYYVHIPIRPFK